MKSILVGIFTLLLIAGCSSSHKHHGKEPAVFFSTDIKPDGTKLFSFSVEGRKANKGNKSNGRGHKDMKSASGGRGGKTNGRGKGRGQGHSKANYASDTQLQKFYARLEEKLSQTDYCRKGYIELDSEFEFGTMRIIGECNESATIADRKKFNS